MRDFIVIDRIEGEFAVCELSNGEMKDIALNHFKEKPREGDIYNIEIITNNGRITYNIEEKNIQEMERRRQIVLEKINSIKNK